MFAPANSTDNYTFFHMGRIGADETDNTQRNIYNTRFSNYTLSNFFNESTSDAHVNFATAQPTVMFSGTNGGIGLAGSVIDVDSQLSIKREQERSLEKLQLNPRPFLTIPYLGKGSCDPLLESQLMHGEMVHGQKSVSTVMDKSFMPYQMYPLDAKMEEQTRNSSHMVQEAAMEGWVRGGALSRSRE